MLIEIKTTDGNLLYSSSKHRKIRDVVEEAVANKVSLNWANLEDVDLSEAQLRKANLRYANLTGANLKSANLNDSDMFSANLTIADLSEANLGACNLMHAKLTLANLKGTNFSFANLECARFIRANLTGAMLSEANLTSANFRLANLEGANLGYANLTSTYLQGANLSGVKLVGTHVDRLSGINYAVCSFRGHGERGRQLLAVEINSEVILFCGCFKGTEQELRYYIEEGTAKFKDSRLLALETVLKLISIKRNIKD